MLDVWVSLSAPALPVCLGPDEALRRNRFLCNRAREDHGTAHSLKRYVLSHYVPDFSPHRWEFIHSDTGKPAVRGAFPYQFNLSHSAAHIAVAVAAGEVGVDIERDRPLAAASGLVQRFFHPKEQRWFFEQAACESAFVRLWTMKEALLKAVGTGFTHPPEQVAWEGLDEPWAHATFAGQRWVGHCRRLGAATLAVAVRSRGVVDGARLMRVAGPGEARAGAGITPLRWDEEPLVAVKVMQGG